MTQQRRPALLSFTLGCIMLVILAVAAACTPVGQPSSQAVPSPHLPKPDHIVIVIEENKSYNDVINSSKAKYINNVLVKNGASLTNFGAFHHPSQPNYYEFFAGTNTITYTDGTAVNSFTITTDDCITFTSASPSLGGLLGAEFKGYAEGYDPATTPYPAQPPSYPLAPCYTKPTPPEYFALKHTPWLVFNDTLTRTGTITDFLTLSNTGQFEQLPRVAMVIPNLIHDMHSLPVTTPSLSDFNAAVDPTIIPTLVYTGDQWLEQNLDPYLDWAMKNNSLLIVTWDEASSGKRGPTDPEDNRIPTILVGEMVKPGTHSDTLYTHWDLLRTIEDMYGLPHLGHSADATNDTSTYPAKDITGIWK
jgi:phosphatidylinositol-3-phosphatase